ncbi:site-specific integrase, partial [Cellulosimicrobium cellulans]|uniref:site-specific integrase n=1 Tax=Cellulosimicrobium cellulans TaxID=1710 RepID=UPI0029E7F24E
MTRADTSEEHPADERVAGPVVALPEAMRAALADFAAHLEVAQGTSAHTVRAYTGDVESLLRHAVRHGASAPRDVDLAALRAWLTTQS